MPKKSQKLWKVSCYFRLIFYMLQNLSLPQVEKWLLSVKSELVYSLTDSYFPNMKCEPLKWKCNIKASFTTARRHWTKWLQVTACSRPADSSRNTVTPYISMGRAPQIVARLLYTFRNCSEPTSNLLPNF